MVALFRCCTILTEEAVSELSNDIRGERLRFVEAMKEATAINVQSRFSSLPFQSVAERATCQYT